LFFSAGADPALLSSFDSHVLSRHLVRVKVRVRVRVRVEVRFRAGLQG